MIEIKLIRSKIEVQIKNFLLSILLINNVVITHPIVDPKKTIPPNKPNS